MKKILNAINNKSYNLTEYQLNRVHTLIVDFENLNHDSNKTIFTHCPKCGKVHPRLIKGGKSSTGKQMYRCLDCEKRFVFDHGQLTFNSHFTQDVWNDFILLTINGDSMKSVAAAIDVHEVTAFRMRHKLLNALMDINDLRSH